MRAILIPLLASALAAQSPTFRGGPSRTGVYPPTPHPLEGRIAWSATILDWDLYKGLEGMFGQPAWPSTVAVDGGRLYTCAGPVLCALDTAGKILYRVRLGGVSLSSPAVAGGTVYVPADDGLLYAVEASGGRILWTCRIGAPSSLKAADAWDVFHSSPLVDQGRIYVGSADGAVYAVEAASGKVAWRFDTGDVVRSSPALDAGRLYVANFQGKVFCLDAAAGARIWEQTTAVKGAPWRAVQATPAVDGGIVYLGSRSTFLFAFEAATGKLLWKHSHDGSWVPSSAAVQDGVAYVGQSDGNRLTAIGADGKVRWTLDTGNATFASPALSGGVLYAATNDNYNLNGEGSLLAVEARTGRLLWKQAFPGSVWSSPVVADGRVYLGSADGKVYAVK